MALTRPPAVSVFGITALIPGVGRFNALSSVASLLMMLLLIVAGAAAANGDLRLVEAARNRDQQTVRTLLNQHADVDVRSHDGATALLWAAHWNDLETADLLIRAGANVNAANDLRITPLSLACTNGNAALVERLLKAGASPNTAIATGETPMMTCASTGNVDAVRMLMARGGDVNAKEPLQNQTALMWAAAEHHPEVVRALIELARVATRAWIRWVSPSRISMRSGNGARPTGTRLSIRPASSRTVRPSMGPRPFDKRWWRRKSSS